MSRGWRGSPAVNSTCREHHAKDPVHTRQYLQLQEIQCLLPSQGSWTQVHTPMHIPIIQKTKINLKKETAEDTYCVVPPPHATLGVPRTTAPGGREDH